MKKLILKSTTKFADYTAEALKKAVKEDDKLKLVNKPGPNTIILELALVKVVPGKPILKTAFFNLKDFSAYGNPKQLVDEWADQIIEVLNSNMGKYSKVERKSPSKIINI
ncbi:MAG: hypothetical protein DRI44_02095 [Chlamydiae bacterium]|nr:MAG: hypothetical protein DRI44_02095 [Chlamydiota bacterium]